MNLREKREALLIFLVDAANSTDASMGSYVLLDDNDITDAVSKCELKDATEVRFFVNALGDEGLVVPKHTLSNIGFQITMDGYNLAEKLRQLP